MRKTIWHWWENGKRVRHLKALQPGIYDMRILGVHEDYKGRMLIDAEMLRESIRRIVPVDPENQIAHCDDDAMTHPGEYP